MTRRREGAPSPTVATSAGRGSAALVLLACLTSALGAQDAPACPTRQAADGAPSVVRPVGRQLLPRYPAPLDHALLLDGGRATLRDALARLAEAARVRFSYSPELVPLDRVVCVPDGATTLGDALRAVLAGTGIVPVVAGAEQVVLAPGRTAASADAAPEFASTQARLERVVVTGTTTGGPERASPFALSVLEGDALAAPGAQSLGQLLDGMVPGMWMWAQSPTSAMARWGSVRGASSFGVTAPKIYVDGIEVANPLLFSQLDASRVQRVEFIRGPQGAALYGADALSGVVNVVTKQQGGDPGAARGELRASAGASNSTYTEKGVIAQDHGGALRVGAAARSAGFGATLSTMGAYVPGAGSAQLLADAGARRVGVRSVLAATARFQASEADAPTSPVLAATLADSTAARQAMRQYTLGATATFQPSDRWMHALTAGIDGYRLSGLSGDDVPIPSASDSAMRAARGGADRLTLRASSTRQVSTRPGRTLALTLGAEHSTARTHTNGVGTRLAAYYMHDFGDSVAALPLFEQGAPTRTVAWWSNTGALAQGQLALWDALFVQGGARLEHISGLANGEQTALLPMLGAAWVRERGRASLKLRAAYGRGIRPARTVTRGATWMGDDRMLFSLAPEEQAGVETGADLFWTTPAARVGVQVTRFDQRASGLAQPVAVVDSLSSGGQMAPGPGPEPREHRLAYWLQNVGAIDNHGWELQASSTTGPLALAATLTLTSSRVANLAVGYRGDLRPGDRMLEVPARTMGLSATWRARRWSLGVNVARATDWVNYDRLALARAHVQAQADSTPPPLGAALRDYWREYEGVTRLGLRGEMALWRGTALTFSGSNLLDRQTGEPDDVTVLPGRTVTAGVRVGF